jgi:hypothetical protein
LFFGGNLTSASVLVFVWYDRNVTKITNKNECHRETFKTAHGRKQVRYVTAEISGLVKNSNSVVYLTPILRFAPVILQGLILG